MTPTKHSNVTTASEGSASSSKMTAQSQDAALFISDMLSQMEEDFRKSGNSIMDRMRKVGTKMDGLEQNILGLVQDAGLDDDDDDDEDDANSEELNSNASAGAPHSPRNPSSPSHMTV